MNTLRQDLRYAVRQLARSPGFVMLAVLILSLGIGASTVVFSVMHSVLWRPLPYPDADRLVILRADVRGVADAGVASGEVLELRERSRHLAAIETINGVDGHVEIDGEHERLSAASVSDGILPLLGAEPLAMGRQLRAEEDVGEYVRSVIISDALWQRRLGGDPAALGRRIQLNNIDVQVVGVLRPDFRLFLPPATLAAEEVDVWFPTDVADTRSRGYPILARMEPGATLAQTQAELDALAAQFIAERPADYPDGDLRISVHSLKNDLTRDVRPALFALAGAVGFVLLIACVNVANLLLARGKARERELAVRRALGAGRGRLAHQLLTESLVLTAAAAVVGLGIGTIGVDLVDWLRPLHLPRQSQITVDGTVALFAVALSVGTTLLFGVLPALRLTSGNGSASLKAGRAESAAPPMRRLQRTLVVSQVALAIVPLVGAGLMLRTFDKLLNAPLGFDPTDVLTAKVALSFRDFPDPEERWTFFHQHVLPQVRELPGVDDVSAAGPLPFGRYQTTRRYGADDDPSVPFSRATQQSVMPGYFRVMGTRLLEGRDFTLDDFQARRPVAVVDERIARQHWPTGALGEQLIVERSADNRQALEIIGVTEAVRVTGVRDDELPHFFVPHHVYGIDLALVMKTEASAATLGPAIKRIVEPQSRRAVFDIRPMNEYVAESIGDTRFTLLVLLGFAAASLLLAGVGVHGTLAYLISQRRRELGVRLALGAQAGRVARMVLREGVVLVATGAVIGLAGAAATTRVLGGLLYEVTPFDAVTLVLVCGLIAAIGLLASWLPARHAARVDPIEALRAE